MWATTTESLTKVGLPQILENELRSFEKKLHYCIDIVEVT